MSELKLSIIGAGIAGLACARIASQHGFDVTLFDKGRGAGGRLSTKRLSADGVEYRFDHGTPQFDAQSPEFDDVMQSLTQDGFVTRVNAPPEIPTYVGTPGMNSVVKGMATDLDVRFSHRAEHLTRTQHGWQIEFAGNLPTLTSDYVVCAIPAEQAADLLVTAAPQFSEQAAAVKCAPVWVGLLGFSSPLPFDVSELSGQSKLFAHIIRNQLKPQRSTHAECLVLHASTQWSQAHLEEDAQTVLKLMKAELNAITGWPLPALATEHAHRWRYAFTTRPVGQDFMMSPDATLGVCGDWLRGASVEDAWKSGTALGEALLRAPR